MLLWDTIQGSLHRLMLVLNGTLQRLIAQVRINASIRPAPQYNLSIVFHSTRWQASIDYDGPDVGPHATAQNNTIAHSNFLSCKDRSLLSLGGMSTCCAGPAAAGREAGC